MSSSYHPSKHLLLPIYLHVWEDQPWRTVAWYYKETKIVGRCKQWNYNPRINVKSVEKYIKNLDGTYNYFPLPFKSTASNFYIMLKTLNILVCSLASISLAWSVDRKSMTFFSGWKQLFIIWKHMNTSLYPLIIAETYMQTFQKKIVINSIINSLKKPNKKHYIQIKYIQKHIFFSPELLLHVVNWFISNAIMWFSPHKPKADMLASCLFFYLYVALSMTSSFMRKKLIFLF